MKTKVIVVTLLFLVFGLLVATPMQAQLPPAKRPGIPPAINAGIQSMVSAKTSLENSGNKWGGHKEPAIKLIDEALKACGQTATPDTGGTMSSPAEDAAAMQAALKELTAAQKHFMSAKDEWGGRRDQALALINQALSEVQAGIDFAENPKECKDDKDCKDGNVCILALTPHACKPPQAPGATCKQDTVCASKSCDIPSGKDVGTCE